MFMPLFIDRVFMDSILFILTLIVLGISSYTDLKTREVPDWASYAFLSSIFGIRLIFSLEYGFFILLSGILGFIVCFVFAHLLYYTRQWGGGDSKILMGMGASIGIAYPFTPASFNLVLFFIFLLFIGAVYGLSWMGVIALRNKMVFGKMFREKIHTYKKVQYGILVLTLISLVITFFSPLFWPFVILIPLFFYLLLFVSCIEEHFFHVQKPILQVTEGDWLAQEVYIHNRLLFSPKTLEKEDIATLHQLSAQHKLSTVLIKEGIPFLPSFCIAYIIIGILKYFPLFLPSFFAL